MVSACADHQIRVMLSDRLPMRSHELPESMDLSDNIA